MALFDTHPTPAAVSVLVEALRGRTHDTRFIAAHLLSRIGPRAGAAVPTLLRLLDEPFRPASDFERKRPELADPAVAAIWALSAISPGTDAAPSVEAALRRVRSHPEFPWRHRDAEEALGRFRTGSTPAR